MTRFAKLAAAAALAALLPAAASAQTHIKVSTVRSTVVGAVLTAKERGYFKEAGLDVDVEIIDASASFIPLLATNELQVVEGAVTASLFNGIDQGLPIKIAIDTTSTPINHNFMLRKDLVGTVKTIADLKGHVVGLNAPNSIASYEVTKLMEPAGLTLNDVETKIVPFPQMGIAFKTHAIDAGLLIVPFTESFPKQNLAVQWLNDDELIKPQPMSISVSMFNTDWATKNPEVATKFYTAMLRGVRDYCNAYHGGAWRADLLKLLVANGVAPNTEFLDGIPWPARNPDGRVGTDFLLDVQNYFVKSGVSRHVLPLDKVVDMRFADAANKALGPFKLENTASTKKGCGRPI